LNNVARLEDIRTVQIERLNRQEVVQYKGGVLPVLRFGDFLSALEIATSDGLAVSEFVYEPPSVPFTEDSFKAIICDCDGDYLGLLVDKILDIIDIPLEVNSRSKPGGIYGSAVIDGKATDLVDVRKVAAAAKVMLTHSKRLSDELGGVE
jgi:two-component system chemotaxis sensor kinase CheA